MKRFVKIVNLIVLSLFLALSSFTSALAADTPVIVGLTIEGDEIDLFISGTLQDEIVAKISGLDCFIGVFGSLSETEKDIRTLFLVDTSGSISKSAQQHINNFLISMVEGIKKEEELAIATFAESFNLAAGFTADRYDIAKAVEQLKWEGQTAGLYGAITAAVTNMAQSKGDNASFDQIVVITDGIDKFETGVAKDEFFFTLKDTPIPIHTLGIVTRSNATVLKDLAAISQITGGISASIENEEQVGESSAAISAHTESVHYASLIIPDEVRDGSIRPLEIVDASGALLAKADIHIPRGERPPQIELPPIPEPTLKEEEPMPEPEPEPAAEPEPEPVPETKPQRSMLLIGSIAGAVVVVGAIIAFIIIRKRNDTKPQTFDPDMFQNDQREDMTLFYGPDDAEEDKTSFLITDEAKRMLLVLHDLEQPHKRFEIMMEGTIEIGRSPNHPGIAIDYDKRISKRHCSITRRNDELYIEDLGSVNKTYVNNEIVRAARVISDNDIITCGKTRLSVKIERR